PDGVHLAVAANPRAGATMLKLADPGGRVLRSIALPAVDPWQGGHASHHVLAWSPDGSRLLLRRDDDWAATTVVAVALATGKVRDLQRLQGPGALQSATWSPDGRHVALSYEGFHDADSVFAIVDAATGRPVVRCASYRGCLGGTVWAPDGRSVF